LRFECYWGKSKEPRAERDVFWLVQDGHFLNELEDVCLAQEKEILADIHRREAEERKIMKLEKEKERLACQDPSRQPFGFHSFIGSHTT
jgi:uncharacterized protein (DUF1015 family)